MWLTAVEQKPKGHVRAYQNVCLRLACLLSHAQATTVEACLQSVYPYGREKETDSRPPQTITYPTSKLSVLPSQERREENRDAGGAVICVHKLLENRQ